MKKNTFPRAPAPNPFKVILTNTGQSLPIHRHSQTSDNNAGLVVYGGNGAECGIGIDSTVIVLCFLIDF